MNCKKCGNEIDKKAVICPNCGCKVKKPIFKKWWFWTIIIIAILSVAASGGDSDSNTENGTASINTSQAENNNSASADTSKDNADNSSETSEKITKEQYIELCETIDFETLSRNPDKYRGKKYGLTGQVIQVQESTFGNTVTLRINITKKTYEYLDEVTYTDTILATVNIPKGEDRLLEDDIINFWGECSGSYTYTSVLGSSITLPKIEIKYFELIS